MIRNEALIRSALSLARLNPRHSISEIVFWGLGRKMGLSEDEIQFAYANDVFWFSVWTSEMGQTGLDEADSILFLQKAIEGNKNGQPMPVHLLNLVIRPDPRSLN